MELIFGRTGRRGLCWWCSEFPNAKSCFYNCELANHLSEMLSDCWADGSARNPQVGLPGVSTGPPTAVWRHPSFKHMFFSSKNVKDLYFTTNIDCQKILLNFSSLLLHSIFKLTIREGLKKNPLNLWSWSYLDPPPLFLKTVVALRLFFLATSSD